MQIFRSRDLRAANFASGSRPGVRRWWRPQIRSWSCAVSFCQLQVFVAASMRRSVRVVLKSAEESNAQKQPVRRTKQPQQAVQISLAEAMSHPTQLAT